MNVLMRTALHTWNSEGVSLLTAVGVAMVRLAELLAVLLIVKPLELSDAASVRNLGLLLVACASITTFVARLLDSLRDEYTAQLRSAEMSGSAEGRG